MDLVKNFGKDIKAMQKLDFEHFKQDRELLTKMTKEIKKVFSQSKEEEEIVSKIGAVFWEKFRSEQIKWTKNETQIRKRLGKLYETLENATDYQWAAYTKIRVEVAFTAQNPNWQIFKNDFDAQEAKEPQKVTVTPPAFTLDLAGQSLFRAFAHDSKGDEVSGRAFKWTSSNIRVAIVNSKTGVVTTVGPGTAKITAQETLTKLSNEAKVTVT